MMPMIKSIKISIKHIILSFNATRNIISWCARKHCPIFMYHRFGDKDNAMSAQTFAVQLDEMKRSVNVLSLSEFCQQRHDGRKDWRKSCVITVDDGYSDFYHVAYPALLQREVSATLFVTTGFLNQESWLWWDVVNYIINNTTIPSVTVEYAGGNLDLDFSSQGNKHMSWDRVATVCTRLDTSEKWRLIQSLKETLNVPVPPVPTIQYQACTVPELMEMADHGITFGAHTVNHPILTRCDPQEWKREILESRKQLSALPNGYIDIFAYPNGTREDQSKSIADFLKSMNFKAGFVAHYDDFKNETQFTLRRCTASADLDEFLWTLWGGEFVCARVKEFMMSIITKLNYVCRTPLSNLSLSKLH